MTRGFREAGSLNYIPRVTHLLVRPEVQGGQDEGAEL